MRDIVAVYHRGLQLYRVNPSTRRLTRVNEGVAIPTAGEGLCLYKSRPSGRLYVFVVAISGMVRQFRIRDADRDGRLGAVEVRRFAVGSEAEGCVADDDRGVVYISEEEVGLWRYRAGPGVAPRRRSVDTVGGHLVADIEGVTLVDLPGGGGYVIASAQNVADPDNSFFVVYDRVTNAYVRSVRVTAGAASDDCDRTDGITATPDEPRRAVLARDLRLPGQQQRRAGDRRQPELQVRAPGAGGRPRRRLAGCALQSRRRCARRAPSGRCWRPGPRGSERWMITR